MAILAKVDIHADRGHLPPQAQAVSGVGNPNWYAANFVRSRIEVQSLMSETMSLSEKSSHFSKMRHRKYPMSRK